MMIAIMMIIYFISIAMAQSFKFFVGSTIGYILMLGISFVDYKCIKKAGNIAFLVAWILYIVVFLILMNTQQVQCLMEKQGNIITFLHTLFILWMPLYGSLIASGKCSKNQIVVMSVGLIMFSMWIELYGTSGLILIVAITVMTLFGIAVKEEIFCFKERIRTVKSWGLVTATGVFAVVGMFVYYRRDVVVFITRESDRAYIYNVLSRFWSESKWFGKSNELGEAISWIPRYGDTCVLTSYVALYGKCIGIAVVMLLLALFIKVMIDAKKIDTEGKMLSIGCALVLLMETLTVVLENMQLMPVVSYCVSMPFFSQRIDSVIVFYLLMGVILSVYRFSKDVRV
jgi:cell division protein FtsW (lipid II flippase)